MIAETQVRRSISIVSINYEPELTGIAVYTTGMAQFLAERGFEVTVHTGFAYYPGWRKLPADEGVWFRAEEHHGVQLRRCYLYVPERPTALRRIVHELTFIISSSLSYLRTRSTDVTIIVSPPLGLGFPIGLLARLKGSRSIFHVQDLQPDAAVDLGMLKAGAITRALFALESLTYRTVDRVSTIGLAMRKRIVAKGVPESKVMILKNWADNEDVVPMTKTEGFRAEWDLEDRFVVLYSGNLGVKQGLDTVIKAMSQLKHHREIALVIVGDGGEKAALIDLANDLTADNVVFRPSVPKTELSRLLSTADVSLIPQRAEINDAVLPSKLGNLLCSRRPIVIAASEGSELGNLVQAHGCGLIVEPGDEVGLAQAVLSLLRDPELRARLADAGYRYAAENLTKAAVLSGLVDVVNSVARGESAITA